MSFYVRLSFGFSLSVFVLEAEVYLCKECNQFGAIGGLSSFHHNFTNKRTKLNLTLEQGAPLYVSYFFNIT